MWQTFGKRWCSTWKLSPPRSQVRKGLPQAKHIHVLLDSGRKSLERLMPELIPELVNAGAKEFDAIADMKWISPGGLCPRLHHT